MTTSIKELVVISGKGGTGKTSVAASLAALAERPVIADCDVDAADLHLVLAPKVRERRDFYAGREAVIRQADCTRCGECARLCRFQAVVRKDGGYLIDPASCEGCGVCVRFCPAKAIDFPERRCGEWMISNTRFGPMVHARLAAAAENSGKLVSLVRREARQIAEQEGRPCVIVDGPPGIGCPVIASLGGATLVLVVTEPTVSGEHDLKRVLALARHFGVPAAVCVNKWDINPAMGEKTEALALQEGARLAGRIAYDPFVTRAQLREQTVVETSAPSAAAFRDLWRDLNS
ncbi:MAG: ATP-binding protein [candidate division FCPU426 bacterium]